MPNKKIDYKSLDLKLIAFLNRTFVPFARVSIFIIFFWFGLLKLTGVSPAGPLARALIEKTVGLQYFDTLFFALAALECIIGLLFLFPKATRVVIPLLLVHMLIVCSPLLLVPNYTWQQPFVPTLEGQYIIKNAVVIAVAIGIAASTVPLKRKK
ncbi:hypothetical protein KW794_02130 [Candidatus Saccharibacteria bacterium]|nr:hypothetical protein [Candidatus Saccharibacteria bacterium]